MLEQLLCRLQEACGRQVIAAVLFGSVARGTHQANSDVDLLLVYDEARGSRRQFQDIFLRSREEAVANAPRSNAPPHISSQVLSRAEASQTPYVLLDIVHEGIVLLDTEGFFAALRARVLSRLRELDARRVSLTDGSWYWNLSPHTPMGAAITI
jgi:predicted nucleotidyltransferase